MLGTEPGAMPRGCSSQNWPRPLGGEAHRGLCRCSQGLGGITSGVRSPPSDGNSRGAGGANLRGTSSVGKGAKTWGKRPLWAKPLVVEVSGRGGGAGILTINPMGSLRPLGKQCGLYYSRDKISSWTGP